MSSETDQANQQSALARVRGLGSGKSGTHHFIIQRVTAVALVPLTFYLVVCLSALSRADYATLSTWIEVPFNGLVVALFLIAGFHHAQLGLQVVIEDYVHQPAVKIALVYGVKLLSVAFAAAGLWALLLILL